MTRDRARNAIGLFLGGMFGLLLVATGMHERETIRTMLLLQDPYLFLVMAAAIMTAAPALWLLRRRAWRTPLGGPLAVEREPVERRHIYGALLFGTGWGITGTCPGPALAGLLAGNLLGLPVVAGLVTGLTLREAVKQRLDLRAAPSSTVEAKPMTTIV